MKIALILSCHINLNLTEPVTSLQIKDRKFEILNSKKLDCIHVNINSLLTKIDELNVSDKCSYAALIGITETKSDNTIDDSVVDGYGILWNDRNRKGKSEACYMRNISFPSTKCLSNNRKNIYRCFVSVDKTNIRFALGFFQNFWRSLFLNWKLRFSDKGRLLLLGIYGDIILSQEDLAILAIQDVLNHRPLQ